MIRAFIDSSVLISASLSSQGASREIMREALRGHVTLAISELVLDECRRNIYVISRQSTDALATFTEIASEIAFEIVNEDDREAQLAEDYTHPKDAPIVAAAKAARVDYLCSLARATWWMSPM